MFLKENKQKVLDADVFIIGGDFYDTILFHPSEDTKYITQVIVVILSMCLEGDTELHVLNGTRTHDWEQCKDFLYVAEAFKEKVKLTYIDELKIITVRGKTILYVPDEVNHESIKTYEQAKQLIIDTGLERVDYIVIHGGFTYQLDFPGVDAHDEKLWQDLVNYLIISGHIHVSIPNGKIVPNGSLDCLVFGESRDKGGWYFTQEGEVVYRERLLNKNAVHFEIFEVDEGEALEVVIDRLGELLKSLPKQSYISIRVPVGHPINNLLTDLKKRHPLFNFYKETTGVPDVEVEEVEYVTVEITEVNLPALFKDFTKDNPRQDKMLVSLKQILRE